MWFSISYGSKDKAACLKSGSDPSLE